MYTLSATLCFPNIDLYYVAFYERHPLFVFMLTSLFHTSYQFYECFCVFYVYQILRPYYYAFAKVLLIFLLWECS